MAYTLQEYYDTGDDANQSAYGTYLVAQTFTAGSSYSIGQVSLKLVRTGSPGTITISIRATTADVPTGGDLVSTTYNGDTINTLAGGTWYDFEFISPLALTSSVMYAVVLSAPTGDSSNLIGWRRDASSPTYANGTMCYNVGATFYTSAGSDQMFKTYSVPVTTYVDMAVTGGGTGGGSATLAGIYVDFAVTGGGSGGGSADLTRIRNLAVSGGGTGGGSATMDITSFVDMEVSGGGTGGGIVKLIVLRFGTPLDTQLRKILVVAGSDTLYYWEI